ncbi:McrB family protein [Litoribrevibacter albus]|uniref:Restriction endonuclease n=1 Tax=Litoribrevibacter albus TaxID=1473156 RepID=A0AA37SBX4_9GAMM|nr:AAA family ATPase [Litoribrevibacter albus]GLQ31727.1 hypothetical protein GCM10007876_22060 [Litoribrevibacter albus]
MKGDRNAVFDYIFNKADEIGYMGLDSSASNKFQDDLQNDERLKEIAGEQLSRNYIKDTVLNNYSKKQRYITKEDVLKAISDIDESNIIGAKKDLENGLFTIDYLDTSVKCTSSSFGEWQTVIKRFGKKIANEQRIAFLTCGGVQKEANEISEVKETVISYGITPIIVKPHEPPIELKSFVLPPIKPTATGNSVRTSKPFMLLAGISGTGKTRFVRKQAEATGQLNETYCLTSVRPDWHEPSDLLGYISRLSGKAEYVTTDVLQFIAKAWRSIIDSGLTVDVVNLGERGERLSVSGDKNTLSAIKPYWLCLDEMNLAPVEQYFADYLSVLETREWDWNGDQFTYSSDALLKPAAINELDNKEKLRKDLGFESVIYDATWQAICQYGLQIPFNLIVAGTVNMDETTHGFSRKVIDRALSFDFGDFFPNDYSEYFEPSNINKTISFPFWSDAKTSIEQLKSTADENGDKSIEFLNSVNAVLKNTPFELAYRALNELLLAVISAQPKDDIALKAVWDDFLMCKVLPRIEGDVDKLGSEKSLLVKLESELSKQLSPIWDAATDSANARPDLYREKLVEEDAPEDEKAIRIQCRSKGKIEWMNKRLSSAGFTSFWP